ncbi:MAG: YfhO family protein, partial [Candidatus Omnitrophica bacterium]|nr:YfhO family protein [Candidatus Omnitrophota bacterium]MBD3268647.1 YfhO family protein [Candidatus Omnitrophota bacterium]
AIDIPAMLVFTDVWYPGWKATVDGRRVRIYRVNYCQRGIYLKEGNHKVEMMFFPGLLKAGLIISGISFLFVFSLGFLYSFKKLIRFKVNYL